MPLMPLPHRASFWIAPPSVLRALAGRSPDCLHISGRARSATEDAWRHRARRTRAWRQTLCGGSATFRGLPRGFVLKAGMRRAMQGQRRGTHATPARAPARACRQRRHRRPSATRAGRRSGLAGGRAWPTHASRRLPRAAPSSPGHQPCAVALRASLATTRWPARARPCAARANADATAACLAPHAASDLALEGCVRAEMGGRQPQTCQCTDCRERGEPLQTNALHGRRRHTDRPPELATTVIAGDGQRHARHAVRLRERWLRRSVLMPRVRSLMS